MFPPVEDAVLQNNPKFAALHKTLTSRLLNTDGSSKNLTVADREVTSRILQIHRARATKAEILRSAITSLPLKQQTPALPPELLELIVILALKLRAPPSTTPLALVLLLLTASAPYDALQAHLPHLGALLSAHLHALALALARVLHPATNPSFLHRAIPKIPEALAALTAGVAAQRAALETARAALVPLTTRVLEQYRAATLLAVRVLEQNKHGQLARAVRSRSDLVAVEAKQVELDSRIVYLTARNAVYTPEVGAALANYREHLRDGRARLRQRQKDAERELERYGVGREGKEKVMREIARVHGEMGRQIREVTRDMERLKSA